MKEIPRYTRGPVHSASDVVVKSMLKKLKRGTLSPAADPRDLEDCYGTFGQTGIDPLSCFSHACRVHGAEIGVMLVATDARGRVVVAQAGGDGGEPPDADPSALIPSLAGRLREALVTTGRKAVRPAEFPVFAMPRHLYSEADGARVARYGQYVTSFQTGRATQLS